MAEVPTSEESEASMLEGFRGEGPRGPLDYDPSDVVECPHCRHRFVPADKSPLGWPIRVVE